MNKYIRQFFYVFPLPLKSLFFLTAILSLMSLIEAVGIGLIGPFLHLANHPSLVQTNRWLNSLYEQFGGGSERHFIAKIGAVLIVIFLLKSIFIFIVRKNVFKFCLEVRGELCKKLMNYYMSAPYIFHLSKDSAHAIQSLNNYAKLFALDIVMPILNSVVNIMIIFALSIVLFLTSWIAVVALLLLLLPLILLIHVFKDKIRYWGKRFNRADESIIRIVNYSLGGIKETKVIGCTSYFEGQLSEQAKEFEDAGTLLLSFQVLPRIVVETILFVFLIGSLSIFLFLNQSIQDLISVLGVFALASLRLLPSISNLSSGISKLRSMSFVLEQLGSDLKEIETMKAVEERVDLTGPLSRHNKKVKKSYAFWEWGTKPRGLQLRREIVLQGVTYQYPQGADYAVQDISLSIKKGESIAFIGQSGAGKTTLVDVILGLLIPQSGDIKIDRTSIYDDLRSWQDLIGYIPQSIFLTGDTIERNIAFGVPDDAIDREKLAQALEAAQLTEVVQNLPEGLQTLVGERGVRLSGGQRQRIGIARALYHGRDILVLDEATSALDNETESLVTESIRSLIGTKTMIVIAHRLTTIQFCDRVYVMEKGQIVRSGSYEEIVLGESMATDQ